MKLNVFALLLAGAIASAVEKKDTPTEKRANPIAKRDIPIEKRDDVTATVDLSVNNGTPQQLASGILYGTPDTQNQIPDHFYTDVKLTHFRAGGAQLFDTGERGWTWNEYDARFQSTLSNYQTARKYGGEFQMLPHDMWATDTANSSSYWPGDDGDWTFYDEFLDQLISDIKANDMVDGLKIDIWNEPDYGSFWVRDQDQYLELWKRTYQKFRSDSALSSVPLIGPSTASQPYSSNSWWTTFMSYVVSNGVQPDVWTWHTLGGSTDTNNDIQNNVATMESFFSTYGASKNDGYCVNEYINSSDERVNSAEAWSIARLERYDIPGLRANWLSTTELHDFLAELIYRSSSSEEYQPNGAWQMYKYYAQSMTGYRLGTSGSTDRVLDVFATYDSSTGTIRILTGVRAQTGTWAISVTNMASLGFASSGTVTIQTYGFDDVGTEGVSDGPSDRGTYDHEYSDNTLTFPIYQTEEDEATAWAFEFTV